MWRYRNFFCFAFSAFVDALMDYNNGYANLLIVCDIFSSKIWLRKLRKKTAKEVELNLRSIIQENGGTSPDRMWTDRGTIKNGSDGSG